MRLFWFSGILSFAAFELMSKKSKDLRLFFSVMGASPGQTHQIL